MVQYIYRLTFTKISLSPFPPFRTSTVWSMSNHIVDKFHFLQVSFNLWTKYSMHKNINRYREDNNNIILLEFSRNKLYTVGYIIIMLIRFSNDPKLFQIVTNVSYLIAPVRNTTTQSEYNSFRAPLSSLLVPYTLIGWILQGYLQVT